MALSRRKATAALLSLAAVAPAHAQDHPSKPVRIVVPTGAGGITAFGQRIRDDVAKWAEIIRQAGIRPD